MAAKKKADADKPAKASKKAKAKEVDPTVQSQINHMNVLIERHKTEIERLEAEIAELQK